MKKTISTLFIALLVAGVSTAKAQDNKKINGKKNAVGKDLKLDPAAKTSTKGVAPAKLNKLVDPADSEAVQPAKVAPTSKTKAVNTNKTNAVPKKELKNAAIKKAKSKEVNVPKDKK